MRIKWLRLALNDINEIAEFIALDNPVAAPKVVSIIYDRVKLLSEHPNMGRHGRVANTRELVITGIPFIIPYRINNNVLEVIRVFHSSMDWKSNFS